MTTLDLSALCASPKIDDASLAALIESDCDDFDSSALLDVDFDS